MMVEMTAIVLFVQQAQAIFTRLAVSCRCPFRPSDGWMDGYIYIYAVAGTLLGGWPMHI